MTAALALLREGKPARLTKVSDEQRPVFDQLGLLTAKPVVYVANVDEGSAATGNAHSQRVEERAKAEGAAFVVISAKIESEIAQLAPAERDDFLATLGLEEPGLNRLIRAGYALLASHHLLHRRARRKRGRGRCTRARARRRRRASSTPISRRASSAPRRSPMTTMSRTTARRARKDAGKMRLEGKDYVVQDGDVMHFRFNT